MIGAPKTEIFRPVARLRSILIYGLESRIFPRTSIAGRTMQKGALRGHGWSI